MPFKTQGGMPTKLKKVANQEIQKRTGKCHLLDIRQPLQSLTPCSCRLCHWVCMRMGPSTVELDLGGDQRLEPALLSSPHNRFRDRGMPSVMDPLVTSCSIGYPQSKGNTNGPGSTNWTMKTVMYIGRKALDRSWREIKKGNREVIITHFLQVWWNYHRPKLPNKFEHRTLVSIALFSSHIL